MTANNDVDRDSRRILSVREINEEISAAIDRAFPRTVWVRGEIQRLPADAARRTHVYFELHETGTSGAAEYQIPVAMMGWDRERFGLGRYLDGTDPDLQIANRLEVCLECQVDYYAKFGKLSLKVVGVDRDFALGRLEARRREVLAFLEKEGLLDAQQKLPLAELPLRVGLITSPGSAAERDFMTGLDGSPYPFVVRLAAARMQGEQVMREVTAALTLLADGATDVIVITRGGGSRADLSWFDQQDLAVAIATCPVPVLTAIGHEIDTGIADRVAHHSFKTPTAVAEALVDRLDISARRVTEAGERLLRRVESILDAARQRADVTARFVRGVRSATMQTRLRIQGLAAGVMNHTGRRLATAGGEVRVRQARLRQAAEGRLRRAVDRRAELGQRLARESTRPIPGAVQRLDHLAAQIRLADPARLLARGYTITSDADGRILKSVADLASGDRLLTRFTDGRVASVVDPDTDRKPAAPDTGSAKARKKSVKKKEEDPGKGNLSLF